MRCVVFVMSTVHLYVLVSSSVHTPHHTACTGSYFESLVVALPLGVTGCQASEDKEIYDLKVRLREMLTAHVNTTEGRAKLLQTIETRRDKALEEKKRQEDRVRVACPLLSVGSCGATQYIVPSLALW